CSRARADGTSGTTDRRRRRAPASNSGKARERQEPAPDRPRSQREPDADGPRRCAVVAVDRARCASPIRSLTVSPIVSEVHIGADATMHAWQKPVSTVWRSSTMRAPAAHSGSPRPQPKTQPKSSVTGRSKYEREARSWLRAAAEAQPTRRRVTTHWLPPTRAWTSYACVALRRWRSVM